MQSVSMVLYWVTTDSHDSSMVTEGGNKVSNSVEGVQYFFVIRDLQRLFPHA